MHDVIQHADCENCPLQVMFNKGRCFAPKIDDEKCDIMVIGDSPIMSEIIAKEAFAGRGGSFLQQALNAVLEDIGFDHHTTKVHYTYATACKTSQEPPAGGIKACSGRLMEEIKIKRPHVIVPLGSGALKSLGMTRAGIMNQRGKQKWDARLDAYIVPTFQPRYVLRNTDVFQTFAKDLEKAVRLLNREKGKPFKKPETKVDVLSNPIQSIKFLKQLRAKERIVASDIETRGFDFRKDYFLCQGFSWKIGHAVVLSEEMMYNKSVLKELKKTIESPKIKWIYHNGKFDNKFHIAQLGIKARTDIDTMLMHYVLDERKGTHDLEQVAVEFCHAEPWEHEAHQYVKESFADIPRPILYKYQGVDCDMTLRVYRALKIPYEEERIKGRKIDKVFNLLMDASNTYMYMELNGFPTDVNYIKKLQEEYEPALENYIKELKQLANKKGFDPKQYAVWADEHKLKEWERTGKRKGKKRPGPTKLPTEFNPNSYMHIRYMLFAKWKLKPVKKKGKITTDADTLKVYKEKSRDVSLIQFIDTKLAYAKDKKMYSTYVKGIWEHITEDTQKVHSTFKLHGTETGRLSSAGPNIHNIPRNSKIKNIFVASKGYVIFQADYSQAELRTLAVESGDPWLQNVYKSGSDLHDQMSIQLYGKDFTKEQRVRAKAVNFGIPYGRSAYTLAAEHNLTVREGKKLIADWYAPQPLTYEYMQERRKDPLLGRAYETPIGRKRHFGLITETNKNAVQNEAGNFPIQATASDLTMWSVCRLHYALEEVNQKYGEEVVRLVNTVHDSIIAEVKEDEQIMLEVRAIFKDIMEPAGEILLDTDVPFVADFEIGYRWGNLYEIEVNDKNKLDIILNKQGDIADFDTFVKDKIGWAV